ncbi:MAG: PKD domain-containing protein [Deltaproteobacteria bacterium]|nr:PKD domain-containing protein [Deltaproteobacteria bacterium]
MGALLLALPLTTPGCPTGDPQTPDPPEAPIAIIADLGEMAGVELGATVQLDGSQSILGANTEDLGLTLTYFWEVDTVPFGSAIVDESLVALGTAVGDDDDSAAPDDPPADTPEAGNIAVEFIPDVVGLYGITLQVSDGTRVSDLDHVVITVGSSNSCPTADAGADVVALTGVPVSLDGTGSTDVDVDDDGNPQSLEWQWSFSLIPNGSSLTDTDIFSQGTATPTIIPDAPGTYILQLKVTDGSCTSEPQYVTVLASNGNGQPVADAGLSITLTPCSPSEVTLDGTASFDPEGQALQYEWVFTQVPTGSGMTDALIEGRFTATPSFNFDVPGLYTLQLRVNDGELISAPDNVAVSAVPALPNTAPVAFAGENIVMNATANCTNNPYTGCSCNPCGARSTVMSALGSYDPDLDAINYRWELQGGTATLLGEESLDLEVNAPEQPVTCGQTSQNVVELDLTVFDCRGADNDTVTITFTCSG